MRAERIAIALRPVLTAQVGSATLRRNPVLGPGVVVGVPEKAHPVPSLVPMRVTSTPVEIDRPSRVHQRHLSSRL
jgi:hypothetical protein